jgi:hypothetical protein
MQQTGYRFKNIMASSSSLKNIGQMAMGGGNQYQQHSLHSGDQTQAFIDCILLYAKNLEADAVSVELQVCQRISIIFSHAIGPVL